MTTPADLGVLFAETLRTEATAAFDRFGLQQPALSMMTAGNGIPLVDGCDGMLWTRVDTVYPTDGTGNPFGAGRIDFDIPGWVFPVHIGFLWCHENIDYEGYAPDPPGLTAAAHRDGQYRAALYSAIVERFPAAAAPYAESYRINPWMPFGPDGGLSGGSLVVNVQSNHLYVNL